MEAVGEEVPYMDARLAELMVRKWQAAKARALGSSHDMAALPEVHSTLIYIILSYSPPGQDWIFTLTIIRLLGASLSQSCNLTLYEYIFLSLRTGMVLD